MSTPTMANSATARRPLFANPLALIRTPIAHWPLIRQLVIREIQLRYRGSVLGLAWAVLSPVLMLVVYTFVFSAIFKMKWGAGISSNVEFGLVMFAGLIAFNVFAEAAGRAPGLILANGNFVKRVVFPLEILPWVTVLSALVNGLISAVLLMIALALATGGVPATALLFPLVLLPFTLFIVGLVWFLSSLGVYFRDLGQIMGIVISALMFLSPVFYPVNAIPENFRFLLQLNPLSFFIEESRNTLVLGKVPSLDVYLFYLAASAAIAWLGLSWFQKTRRGFPDVI